MNTVSEIPETVDCRLARDGLMEIGKIIDRFTGSPEAEEYGKAFNTLYFVIVRAEKEAKTA